MLSDVTKEETELLEVVSVLVQITAPWIEDDHIIKGLVYHLNPILNALSCKPYLFYYEITYLFLIQLRHREILPTQLNLF